MSNSSPERNKGIALEAFETLFNKRDYAAAECDQGRICERPSHVRRHIPEVRAEDNASP
jgi:hypothetical protein